MTDRRHLADADVGACQERRFEMLRDVTQRGNVVSPRAREYEPAAIEPPEVRPLQLSPFLFKPRE